MNLIFRETKQTTISRFTFNTKNKYVHDIWYASNPEEITVYYQEDEDGEQCSITIPVDRSIGHVDLVEFVALKHQYDVVFVYNVW